MDDEQRLADLNRELIEEIAIEAAQTARWTGRDRFSERVMSALAAIPRHHFVPSADRSIAYINRPLGIGYGQTISQPYIVGLMTDLLDLAPTDRVLEIGTGSGYQAAVLSGLCAEVYSVEVVADLGATAQERLARLGYGNVHIRQGDGYLGWPERAPFDGIILTAAPITLPEALCEQLAPGGRIVAPLGVAGGTQILFRGVKDEHGAVRLQSILPVAFVPMVHEHGGQTDLRSSVDNLLDADR